MKKQAILIMYHNDYYVLDKLLKEIDLEYFDVYLHIDIKVKNDEYKKILKNFTNKNIILVKRSNVRWSSYSQIACELKLLEAATKGKYQYYHFISGNDLLIKSSKEIYNFFAKQNKEFIGYVPVDDVDNDLIDRIRLYHFLNGFRKHNNELVRNISNKIYYNSLRLQRKIGINRLKFNKLMIKKGANWVSITHDFAMYIINNKKIIRKMFRFSNCADELFMQTMAYNSSFKDKIYDKYDDEHKNIYRFIDWNRGEPYVFRKDDFDLIMNSSCFFARKFSSQVDKEIIDKIFDSVMRR